MKSTDIEAKHEFSADISSLIGSCDLYTSVNGVWSVVKFACIANHYGWSLTASSAMFEAVQLHCK